MIIRTSYLLWNIVYGYSSNPKQYNIRKFNPNSTQEHTYDFYMFATITYETIIMLTQSYQLLIQRGLLLVRSKQGCLLQFWTMDTDPLWFFRGFYAMNMEYVSIQDGSCSESTFHQKLTFVSQPM